jgi:hypothetical protein
VANASTIREDYRIASIPDSLECSAIKETKAIPSSKTEQPTNAGKASERIVVAATWTRSGPEIEEGFVVLQSVSAEVGFRNVRLPASISGREVLEE